MLNNLEIVLITYNRAGYLRKTLDSLSNSPFCDAKITVLDNASQDGTPKVCEEFTARFRCLHTIRNLINIGGNANYLRAVEISTSEYTWILCDDDSYDFSSAEEVLEILEQRQHDLVLVGPLHPLNYPGGISASCRQLAAQGMWFHLTLSFFPAVIFRTRLFDADCMVRGFRTIAQHYPNFPFIDRMYQDDRLTYVPSRNLVIRNEVDISVLSPLEWYNSWVICCNVIAERRLRKEVINHATAKRGFFKSLAFWLALEHHVDRQRFFGKVVNIWMSQPVFRKIFFPLLLPAIVFPWPLNIMIKARSLVYRLMKVPDSEVPPVKVVDRDNE